MSSSATGFTEERQHVGAQAPVGVEYVPTEEEKRVFKECNNESFWYRSVPFSMVGVAITQALVAKGVLSASPRFGSLPKVAFAGFCGYLAGKMSYMKTCQEKFKSLENSPLGDALRQRTGLPPQAPKGPQSEMSDPDNPTFDTMFQHAEAPKELTPNTRDNGYGFNAESPVSMGKADDFAALEDEEPRKRAIHYEDLRLKNRENYEVTLTQKAETLLKTSPEKEPGRPRKDVKKNVYGDSWEE
ncbi:OCIA domain-containing protein 1-like isoform X2 [Anoplopoma fimbria]|uniref:OCIA domain-containing protein 1-like isoform X2 n=1 Tax=Anoplopoma fimbria TaxID=229290 RepID=UPI0023EB5EFA|nr:OCIA domain-containing protein 1-like isoform X2 [Anoplopoma fimbria]